MGPQDLEAGKPGPLAGQDVDELHPGPSIRRRLGYKSIAIYDSTGTALISNKTCTMSMGDWVANFTGADGIASNTVYKAAITESGTLIVVEFVRTLSNP
ncbi:MAG TPA: hypothetical protein VG944_11255 [Fimbriimonas sp.]|nr:hypothetical protein [Fimbriimonas sp.]